MNRRDFNKLTGFALAGTLVPLSPQSNEDPVRASSPGLSTQTSSTYRRLLIDTHVPDWDPRLLANFNATDYVNTIANAGLQELMQYANSHVGLCLWKTKIGQMHAAMKGRDYFGEVMEQCHRRGLHATAYYSVIYDDWAFRTHPDWRIVPEQGQDLLLGQAGFYLDKRPGVVCPNSPYREHALTCLRELVRNYDFESIFIDMTFWPTVCYCQYCTDRFFREHNAEPPRILNWDDPLWRTFQKSRESWLLEFAKAIYKTIKDTRPISVSQQASTVVLPWQLGVPIEFFTEASDYSSGDFYGGATEYSVICKLFQSISRTRPFEIMISRQDPGLQQFASAKPYEVLLGQTFEPTIHSAAHRFIDAIKPDGTLTVSAFELLGKVNGQEAIYERFLGGTLVADIAIYFDKASLYNPADNGKRVSDILKPFTYGGNRPHLDAVVGVARMLREAHIPFGIVTSITLDQLKQYRAVIIPYVLEMTGAEAEVFRQFVREGGILYASALSSLDRSNPNQYRFLLEDVLGVRYAGTLGSVWTYLTPTDDEMKKTIWPQEAVDFDGPMTRVIALPGAQVLARVTLPFVDPDVGNALNTRFAQIWSNPPALTPSNDPGIVVNSFGRGHSIWVAACIESGRAVQAVNARLVTALLRRVLPGPYHFEVDAYPWIEMTLFSQPENRRLLVSLLNTQQERVHQPSSATVKVRLPEGRRATRILRLPELSTIPHTTDGVYVQYHANAFPLLEMALVEYE